MCIRDRFYSFAYTIFNMSHNLMVPLSTRDATQRGSLSVFNQISNIMMTGILVALVFPTVIMPIIGVDQGKWIALMSVLSILALPLTLLEYYFTKERVTPVSYTHLRAAGYGQDRVAARVFHGHKRAVVLGKVNFRIGDSLLRQAIGESLREPLSDLIQRGVENGGVLALDQAHGADLAGNGDVHVLAHDLPANFRRAVLMILSLIHI